MKKWLIAGVACFTYLSYAVARNEPNSEVITVKGVSFAMIHVDGGTFTMGTEDVYAEKVLGVKALAMESENEMPAHTVVVDDFSIGETEVTQELWETVMGSNPSEQKGSKQPVTNVSWTDCQQFVQRLSDLTGRQFRLPTEAEWEYAARGGRLSKGCKYSGSNSPEKVAWFSKQNKNPVSQEVKKKQPNELGLYDMSGNVWEWCSDWYAKDYYSCSEEANPKGPKSGDCRVQRGGSCALLVWYSRVTNRSFGVPTARQEYTGLRLAL